MGALLSSESWREVGEALTLGVVVMLGMVILACLLALVALWRGWWG